MKIPRHLLLFLGLVISGLPEATAAAAPFRLFEIGITRFVRDASGQGQVEAGRLNALGLFTRASSAPSTAVDAVPAEFLGRNLIFTEAWHAYGELGSEARANFRLANGGQAIVVRGLIYFQVEPHDEAKLDFAPVINLSARGQIGPGLTPTLIGGFVIEGRPGTARRVLIRAIGPSLAEYGVPNPAADPFLSIEKRGTTFSFNGNWGERFDADEIALTAAQVGAFPLPRTSKDAVLLIELTSGIYTASVVTEGASPGGTVLLEIYVLP